MELKKEFSCSDCKLNKSLKTDIIGKGNKKILIIDSLVSFIEMKEDELLMDKNSKTLKALLRENGINPSKDCWYTKAIKCYSNKENLDENVIKSCRSILLDQIKELKPEKIITFGYEAIKMLIGHRVSTRISITKGQDGRDWEKWIGWKIPDQELGAFIFPNYDFRKFDVETNKDKVRIKLFEKNLREAIEYSKPFYENNYSTDTIITTNITEATKIIEKFENTKLFAFDYETTGIKPHAEGHRILCIGISDGQFGYCFPIFDNEEFKIRLSNLLSNRKIKKYGWNISYEHTWTREILGAEVKGWLYDGMIGSHILDNRSGTTSLKFQSYTQLGILGYDDEVDKYMTNKPEYSKRNSNGINKLDELEIEKILEYCALDALFTYKICEKQHNIFKNDKQILGAYNFFHDGILTLNDISENGFYCNSEIIEKNKKEIDIQLVELKEKINLSKEAKLWTEGEFNMNSSIQLGKLLYEVLEYPILKKTAKGSGSTDKDSLASIETEFTDNILMWKKLNKIKNTDIKGLERESVNNIIHPSYNLHIASSFRSSSNSPNAQNWSKRDPIAKKYVRGNITPPPGMKMIELDFSGIEVGIGCSFHRDSKMIEYVLDESLDMHRDTAMQLFFRDKDTVRKEERFAAKNGFVFAQFYGDFWKNCAENVWKLIDKETKDHLKENGISRLGSVMQDEDGKIVKATGFYRHVWDIEKDFWFNRFKEYNQWRWDNWNSYLETGEVNYYTGFRIKTEMTRKQVNNLPIQGSAFHCLLWCLIELNSYLKRNKCKSMIIGQIHDSIIMYIDENEWNSFLKKEVKEIMTVKIREEFKWIVTPMRVDVTYYGNSWADEEKDERL